ncbi:MAG: hypothetical protein GY731_00475, partial [Gammaproteobacteria bacterium]|nr:hypothetical protein [Gammaproteobacteria bacterium]
MFDRQIQYAVDRLLLEQGVYTPVELLLAEGRLKYRDYETWREGDCVYLEDTLFGDPEQIDLLLEQAAGYARALGLTPEELNYRAWGGGEGGSLHFSRIRELDERFFTRYRTAVDKPQMDLFMDATGAVLANGIAHALTNRDTQEARRLLDLLFNADPGQTQLAGLERLVEASEHIDSPVGDIAEELQHLRCQLVPLADDLLGPGSRHFTAPHWRRMSRALQAVGFDPARPEMHLSYSTHQGSEWEGVKESVESVSGWHEQSVLLCRHARACGRLHLQSEEMSSWFSLCWRFPDQAWVIGTDAEP